MSLVDDTLEFSINGKLVLSDIVHTHWAIVSRDEVEEYIEGFSEVVYAVASLTIGELLVHNAIKNGDFHNSQIRT